MPNARAQKLRDKMKAAGAQAMLVGSAVNRRYLSGFTGTHGMLLVTGDKAALVTDFRYMEQAGQQAKGYQIVEHQGTDLYGALAATLKDWGVTDLWFEDLHLTFAEHAQLTKALAPVALRPAGGVIEELRMIKDADEIAIMQEAAVVADKTFRHILGFIKPGVTELAIAAEMESYMRKLGASGPSFNTIVASGERSALPHGVASERIVGRDEFVKLDFGAYYKGYCSDLTRTIVVGKPSDKHREIYGIVKEAQQYALDHLKAGMTGREGDALTRDIITRYGYGDHFGHGTGHGFGMEIHEAPRLNKTGEVVLQPGMTVTVEPGIYLPGFGGVRIEDDVVITDTGIQILTSSPKELIVLD